VFPFAAGEAGSRSGPGLHFHAHRNRNRMEDLESTASVELTSVELTSEDNAFPIESALFEQDKGGWRAAEPGAQTIRLISIRLISIRLNL
jgi:hypothetical protein